MSTRKRMKDTKEIIAQCTKTHNFMYMNKKKMTNTQPQKITSFKKQNSKPHFVGSFHTVRTSDDFRHDSVGALTKNWLHPPFTSKIKPTSIK